MTSAAPFPAKLTPAATAWDSMMGSWRAVTGWFDAHWGDIAAAALAALILFGLLYGFRMLARRRESRAAITATLPDVFLRAAARTKTVPLIIVSLCVAIPYTNPPSGVRGLVSVLLTITLALQGAAWLRDVLIGVVQRRASEGGSETLTNALPIVRPVLLPVRCSTWRRSSAVPSKAAVPPYGGARHTGDRGGPG